MLGQKSTIQVMKNLCATQNFETYKKVNHTSFQSTVQCWTQETNQLNLTKTVRQMSTIQV